MLIIPKKKKKKEKLSIDVLFPSELLCNLSHDLNPYQSAPTSQVTSERFLQ